MKDGDLSADDLKGVLDDDPGPETVRDALTAAFASAETGADDEPNPFAGKPDDAEADPVDPPAESAASEDTTDDDPPADAKDDDEPLDPPADWSAAEHETFRSLTPAGQKFVLEKAKAFQADYTKKTEEVARERDRFAELDKVIGPRREAWKMNGWNEAQAVERLFALSDYATRDPAGFVKFFAESNKLDLATLAPKPAAAPEDEEYVDPQVKALRDELAAVKAHQAAIAGGLKTREQQEAEAVQRQHQQVLRDFETATDEKGAPKHPYFKQVGPIMGSLMQSGRAPDLETAYAMAVYADPEVRAKVSAAEKAARDREAQANQRRQADKARRAGSSITGTPAGTTAALPKATVREELLAQFQAQGVRV